VSGHVTDRLSAFLDDELEAREREAVARHLEACAECARFLEELAAVDRVAAAEPVPEPDQGFVGRVRARIRAPEAARPRFALPRWALASAAVLAIAVVAPLLLQRHQGRDAASLARVEEQRAGAPARSDAAPAAPPPMAAPPPTTAPALDKDALGYAQEGKKRDARRDAPALLEAPAKAQANAVGEARAKREEPKAVRLRDEAAPADEVAAAEADLSSTDTLAGAASGSVATQEREAPAPAPAARPAAPASGFAEAPAEGPRPQAQADLRKSVAGPSAAFRALAARPATTIAEARGLREAWRAFATGAVGGEADDARVRVIETGLQAWQLSAEAADLELARRDAAAYLRRDDAAHKDRVRALLAAAR
jgi:hypothetical protein